MALNYIFFLSWHALSIIFSSYLGMPYQCGNGLLDKADVLNFNEARFVIFPKLFFHIKEIFLFYKFESIRMYSFSLPFPPPSPPSCIF